ncbi:MAG: hypothetical protein ACRENG_32920 [bacterium]
MVLSIDTEYMCPDCQVPLVSLDSRDRTVTEVEAVRVKKVLYQLTRRPALRDLPTGLSRQGPGRTAQV